MFSLGEEHLQSFLDTAGIQFKNLDYSLSASILEKMSVQKLIECVSMDLVLPVVAIIL